MASVTLEPDTEVLYKVTNFYSPAHDAGLAFDDPELGVDWGLDPAQAILSPKDRCHPRLAQAAVGVLMIQCDCWSSAGKGQVARALARARAGPWRGGRSVGRPELDLANPASVARALDAPPRRHRR